MREMMKLSAFLEWLALDKPSDLDVIDYINQCQRWKDLCSNGNGDYVTNVVEEGSAYIKNLRKEKEKEQPK